MFIFSSTMDIVDIDKALGDSSFCLMGERNQGDVANILQQWKCNMQQGMKDDTKTFTRSKRKAIQKSDKGCYADLAKNTPINLQIGGLVTNLTKNPLQDVSSSFSAYSSMDLSTEIMNNSLISSADFTNVSFFKTTSSEDLSTEKDNDLTLRKFTGDNIQSLSLSGESTLIKDKNISHTDVNLCKMFNDVDVSKAMNNEINYFINNSTSTHASNDNNLNSKDLSLRKSNGDSTFNLSNEITVLGKPTLDGNIVNVESLDFTTDLGTSDNRIALNKTFERGSKQKGENIANEIFTNLGNVEEKRQISGIQSLCLTSSEEEINLLGSTSQTCETYDDFKFQHCRENLLQSTPYQRKSAKKCGEGILLPLSPTKPTAMSFSPASVTYNKKLVNKLNHSELNNKSEIQFNNSITDMELCIKQSEDEFDRTLKGFGRIALTEEHKKMRQSIDNIKRRHSVASDSLDEEVKSSLTNKNSLLNCNERLLSRRGRLYDEISELKESKMASFEEKQIGFISEKLHNNISDSKNKEIPANINILEYSSNLKNPEKFRMVSIKKKADGAYCKTVTKSEQKIARFYPKEKNIINANCDATNYALHERADKSKYECVETYQTNEGRKNSEGIKNSNLEKLSCENKFLRTSNSDIIKVQKELVPTKAKSYQNLSSQFGTSKAMKLPLERQTSSSSNVEKKFQAYTTGIQKLLGSCRTYSVQHMHLKQSALLKGKIKAENDNLFKGPATVAPIRSSKHRKSGLVRPSSGFYSCSAKRIECELEHSRTSSTNSLSSVSSKGSVSELHRKFIYEQGGDGSTEKSNNFASIRKTKISDIKSNIPKPSSSAARKSVIPLLSKNIANR